MALGSEGDRSTLESLSALADGELDAADAAQACVAWRDDAALRLRWHTYQLIGDVLRSDDLASAPARDAAFLAALRQRLAAEPTVLAPQTFAAEIAQPGAQGAGMRAARAGRSGRWSWMAPSAVAAGFVLVAGALMVTRGPLSGTEKVDGVAVAKSGGALPATAPALAPNDIKVVQRGLGGTGKVVRDPRLDRYLAAHQQFAGASPLGVPSGFLRNATAEAPSR